MPMTGTSFPAGVHAGSRRGLSLVEIVAALVISGVVTVGTLTALTTAVRVMNSVGVQVDPEADGLAQQTLERYRNRIACDDPWFEGGVTPCVLLSNPTSGTDALPSPTTATSRTYAMTPGPDGPDADTDADYYIMAVNVKTPE